MQEKRRTLKDYQYPDMDIMRLEGVDIVTLSDSSNENLGSDIDPDQGEWD